MTERPTFYLVRRGGQTAAGDEPHFGHTGEDEMVLVSLDAYEEMRQRTERAEARIASVSGVEREELVRLACERQREACARTFEGTGNSWPPASANVCRSTPLALERKS